MKTQSFQFSFVKKRLDELTPKESELVEQAKEATFRSYSPYSHFSVGASLWLKDDTTDFILTGSNQENCAYPSGLCAERTVLFHAGSQYPDIPVKALCIAARDSSGIFTSLPVSPCGGCRQVMVETERRHGQKMTILLYGTEGIYVIPSALDLMPLSFTL